MAETNVVALTEGLVAIANTTPEAQAQSELRPVFDKLLPLMQRTNLHADEQIRVLRTFEVAAAQMPRASDPEIKKQVHAALIKQMPAAPAGRHVGGVHQQDRAGGAVRPVPARASPGQGARLHRRARRGRPDPRDDAEGRRGSARARSTSCTRCGSSTPAGRATRSSRRSTGSRKASKWRGGSTFAGHVNNIFERRSTRSRRPRSSWPTRPRRFRADHRRHAPRQRARPAAGGCRCSAGRRAARAVAVAAVAGRACRSIARNATTTSCSRAAAARVRSTGRGGAPNATDGERVFRETCAQCHRSARSARTTRPT